MENGQKHVRSERIIIPRSELTNPNWKIHADGLLEAPDGRTEFPGFDAKGPLKISYYIDETAVVVKSVFKS